MRGYVQDYFLADSSSFLEFTRLNLTKKWSEI